MTHQDRVVFTRRPFTFNCREFYRVFLGYYLNSKSISQFDQSRDGSMVEILESLLKFNELKEEEIFNLFYSIQTKYMPKLSDALETGIA